ncbi:MAG: hypothetical protein K2G30_08925 [Muribaculaceae bacterium]|nr:hypothetical protein [Muribaculaceae bacterium]MDE7141591.1 hypothetical protein [Muribaculaceae bacterium]
MTKISSLLATALVCGAAASLVSCDSGAPFVGIWKATAPSDLPTGPAARYHATSVLTVSFADAPNGEGGAVGIVSDFTVSRSAGNDSLGYEIDAIGTARVDGTWSYDIDDRDDLLLDLDYNTLKVDFPASGVSVSGPLAARLTAAQLDSVRADAASACSREISRAMTSELRRFSVVKDIEVSKDKNTLGFEIESPETDLRFRRVAE